MALVKNLLLILASIVLGLVVLEGVLWIVAPPTSPQTLPKGLLKRTPISWILKPGTVGIMDNRRDYRDKVLTVDRYGRRITPAARAIAGSARRIHLMGDSQTFGHGLADDETWANRLQEVLIARQAGAIEVRNYGVPGVNVDQYRERMREVLGESRPGDVVLVGLSWNDLITNLSHAAVARLVEGYLVTVPPAPKGSTGSKGSGAVGQNDDGVSWRLRLYEAVGLVLPRFQSLKQFLLDFSVNSALASFIMPHVRGIYFRFRTTTDPFRPLIEDGVAERNFVLLSAMKREAEAKGLSFAVVNLPSRFFVEDAIYDIYSQNGRAFPARNYQGHITRPLCARFRITCFDAFDVLLRHNREGVVFPIDGHYNEFGARLVGEFVADAIAPLLAR